MCIVFIIKCSYHAETLWNKKDYKLVYWDLYLNKISWLSQRNTRILDSDTTIIRETYQIPPTLLQLPLPRSHTVVLHVLDCVRKDSQEVPVDNRSSPPDLCSFCSLTDRERLLPASWMYPVCLKQPCIEESSIT